MLVLSRKEGERIVIGDQITLVVSKVSGNRVTIGIEAPKDVKITRGELVTRGEFTLDSQELDFEGVCAAAVRSEAGAASLGATGSTAQGSGKGQSPAKSGRSLREFAASVLPLQRQVG
jgi:carbon storage regulator